MEGNGSMDGEDSADPGTRLVVGLCQILTEEWAVGPNVDRAIDAIREAAASGAHLAITPECVPHGYAKTDAEGHAEHLLEVSEPANGTIISRIRDAAASHSIAVVFGFAERDDFGRLYNAAAVICSDGNPFFIR